MSFDWEDDEELGYRKPPKWTRFRKGQSGNPKGRPKKVREEQDKPPLDSEADRALRRELDRRIQITGHEGTAEVTMADAIVRKQVTEAAKGNSLAMRDVRRAQLELERREAERREWQAARAAEERAAAEQSRQETFQFVCEVRDTQAAAWRDALAAGRAEPEDPWPHPDDVTLNYATQTFQVRGPFSADELPRFEYFQALRDQFFVQIVVLLRSRDRRARAKVGFYAGLMGIYEAFLPKRWTLGDDFIWLASIYIQMPLRFLRDDLKRSERKAKLLRPLEDRLPLRFSPHYASVNTFMKPVLKPMGYASYAQFEVACEETGDHPPWPKRKKVRAIAQGVSNASSSCAEG